MDAPEHHAEIEEVTGLKPSHVHIRSESVNKRSKHRWKNNIWLLSSPLEATVELSEHLNWLWQQTQPHKVYFRSLIKSGVKVDIFCGYRSNCDHSGFGVNPSTIEIAKELDVRLEFSVIIT